MKPDEDVGLAREGVEEANRLKVVFMELVDRDAETKRFIVAGCFSAIDILLQDALSTFIVILSND